MQSLIARYEAGGRSLRDALAGLTESDFQARPGPGDWSIQELVIHLQDSDAVGLDRMRRVIAEDNPSLLAYDENKFVAGLHCDAQSVEDAVTALEVGRRQFARVLRKLPAESFQRQGVHSEAGPLTLQQLLQGFVNHLEHHLGFLLQKRERLGKPV